MLREKQKMDRKGRRSVRAKPTRNGKQLNRIRNKYEIKRGETTKRRRSASNTKIQND